MSVLSSPKKGGCIPQQYWFFIIWAWTKDENSHDNDDSDLWTKFWTAMDGSFDITQGNSGSHFTLTKGDGTLRRLVYENSDGNTYDFTAVWRVPYDLLGKTLKFSWNVKCDYTNGLAWDTHYSVSPSGCEITLPKAQATIAPQATMATMSYSEVGQLEMPWFMGATTLTAVRYEYVDAYGITVWKEMPTNENNGTIYLDATVPHDNFAVVVSYKDNNGYDVTNISSGSENLQMIHAPVGLTATPTGNHKAAVRLDWHIIHPRTNDITSSDFFEVQRSLTGQEADFVTIGSVPFTIDLKNPYFTFTDSTLVAAVTAAQLTAGSSLPNLSYRVRRMITQTWGWDGNPCAQRVEAPLSGMHLQRLKSYTAQWADERAYTVRVDWEYVKEPNAVWDSRAKLMMVVTMRNKAGEQVDTKTYELTDEESDTLANATDEELSAALTAYIKEFVEGQIDDETYEIKEAVSDWFDGHCHSDDFDSEYERQQYFQDLINGEGDADYIYDEVIDEIEYEFLTEDEVSDLIDTAILPPTCERLRKILMAHCGVRLKSMRRVWLETAPVMGSRKATTPWSSVTL